MNPAARSLESAIASALVTDVVSGIFKRDAASAPDFVGENARYAIKQLLGDGCSGSVYVARDSRYCDEHHEELVAVKVLRGEESAGEARKVRYVKHANVVQSLDFGDGFIVFEYIPGGPLDNQPRPMRARNAASLVAQIADGVQAAHSRGLIHRDLKPANVLLDDDGTPKVADFGIAVLDTHAGGGGADLTGNRAFMAPELFAEGRRAITTRIDVYALGCMLYWLVTDSLPHGSTVDAVVESHRAGNSPRLRRVDADLTAICAKAMAADPTQRYETAAQFASDLRSYTRHEPIEWRRPGPLRKATLFCRRRPGATALGISGALVLFIGTGAVAYFAHGAREAESRHGERFEGASKDFRDWLRK